MKSNVVTFAIAALVTLASPYSHASLYEQLPEMPPIEQPSSPGVTDRLIRLPWKPPVDWMGQQQLVATLVAPSYKPRYDPDIFKPIDSDSFPPTRPTVWPWPRHWDWIA